MNGVHDMGGMMGFGPVAPEPNEPLFHAGWERRALGVTLAMGATGSWTLDRSRATRESLPPATYLASSYYEIWIRALERLVVDTGLVGADELAAGHALHAGKALRRVLRAADVPAVLAKGAPTEREPSGPARFQPGDRVRTRNMHPTGHTRLPRYVRDRVGTVELIHGAHVFPDTSASGAGEQPQWLYTVLFAGRDIWGPEADPTLSVSVDAWESYLDPA